MPGSGQKRTAGKIIEYTGGDGADTSSWSSPSTMADWAQIIGAGSTVLKDEGGTARTFVTDGAEPSAVLPGPFSAFTSSTATRVRLGMGPMPALSVPGSGTAAQITIADAGTFTTQTTAEGALQELYQHLFSAVGGYIPIPLSAWREVSATGDVGDITANGGVLASDTTPVFDAVATSNEQEILWATGNTDPIGVSIVLPRDFDDTADATLDLVVSSGTTNAATIVCASAWSAGAAGTEVSDSTSDTGTKSATPHTLSITIDKGDIPAGARRVTIRLTPPSHSTDTISLYATGIAYKRKLLTS